MGVHLGEPPLPIRDFQPALLLQTLEDRATKLSNPEVVREPETPSHRTAVHAVLYNQQSARGLSVALFAARRAPAPLFLTFLLLSPCPVETRCNLQEQCDPSLALQLAR